MSTGVLILLLALASLFIGGAIYLWTSGKKNIAKGMLAALGVFLALLGVKKLVNNL